MYWCWDNGIEENRESIDTEDLLFPKDFLWGTAAASYQCEGPGDKAPVPSNWSAWEPAGIKHGQRCGQAADHYHRYVEDIDLMRNLGCNAYRFSLAWDKIEPTEGQYDSDILTHYHRELKELHRQSIVPMITFHHFVHPLWFEERSAFLAPANVAVFVRFATDMFLEFETECRLWCTINEPEVYVSGGYFTGIFPPGRKSEPNEASLAIQHLLRAHVEIYDSIKAKAEQPEKHSVGIVKDIFQFDAWNPLNPLDIYASRILDHSMNGCILDFLRTGEFKWTMPGSIPRTYINVRAPRANDFIGLNYYSHFLVRFNPFKKSLFEILHHQDTSGSILMTDMAYPLYPEGLYRACVRLKDELPGVPIYITENGIADRLDDRRHLFLRRYLYALSRAINEAGCDVRGYFYWSLVDNFEWAEVGERSHACTLSFAVHFRVTTCDSVCTISIFKRKRGRCAMVPSTFNR